MKRYEKMSKEEIIDVVCGSTDDCNLCPFYTDERTCRNVDCSCGKNLRDYLSEEIKTKKVYRYETIKCLEDLDRLKDEFVSICDNNLCTACIYLGSQGGTVGCFEMWLKEEIEVQVEC